MKNVNGQNWLHSKVTLTDALSYRVAGQKFIRGRPADVVSPKVRRALTGLSGFQIVDFWEPLEVKSLPPQEPVDEPVESDETDTEPETDSEPESKPKAKTPKLVKTVVKPKSKTMVKTTVRKGKVKKDE